MRLVFMGTPDFAVPTLDRLAGEGHDVACVYTQPPRAAGRGQKERPTPVHARAERLGLEVRTPASLKGPEEQARFAALRPEVAVVAAYGLILPQAILDAPDGGCFNVHASLLPRWRGAAPVHRAIMAGDAETGVCIMGMEAGLDTGPVFVREALPIGPEDTTGDLTARLAALGARLMARALRDLDACEPEPQPEAGVTYARKIDKAEARIDWGRPAEAAARHVNGLSPAPGAWTTVAGRRLKVLRARAGAWEGSPDAAVGAVGAPTADAVPVRCPGGAVHVIEVQPEGKARLAAPDWLRGRGDASAADADASGMVLGD